MLPLVSPSTRGMKRNMRKTILACVAVALSSICAPQTAHPQDVLEVISPRRFETFHGFPVKVEVRFFRNARPETFMAWLNGEDITRDFRKTANGARAVVGPEDGLRIEPRTDTEHEINVLRTRVQGVKPEDNIDFDTFFFVAVDKLAKVGSGGGAIHSIDKRLFIKIPPGALSSDRIITLTKLLDGGPMGAEYQLAPEGQTFKRPLTVTMKYAPEELPTGVPEDDLFLISGNKFPRRLEDLSINKTGRTVRGSLKSLGRVRMSCYVTIGKTVEDIPWSSRFRLPVGDHSDASYTCGSAGEAAPQAHPADTLNLLRRSSFFNFAYPRILLTGNERGDTWHVVTAYGRNRYVNSASGPTQDRYSFIGEEGDIFSNGEDWRLGDRKNHDGDLPVRAIADGLIIYNGTYNGPGYGNVVALAHRIPAGPIVSVYSHLSEESPCAVGTVVHQGSVIGKIRSVDARQAELHYELGKDFPIRVDADSKAIKVPAAWFGCWIRDEIYARYYDPTNFVININGRYAWDFNVEGNDEGWVVKNVKKNGGGSGWQVKDGMLSFQPASRHVQVCSYPLKIDSDRFDSVFVRIRSHAGKGRGRLYFATDEAPDYSEDKAVEFEILDDDGFREYGIFMADHPQWRGTIAGIRMDFLDALTSKTAEINVHSIRFGRGYLSKTPDTGQSRCYDNSQEIPCPAPGAPFHGQDGQYDFSPLSYEVQTINGEEVVVDRVTGLTWKRADDGIKRTWREAAKYCEDLMWAGYSDWRLPTKKELESIVSYGARGPALDTTYFPPSRLASDDYWTATTLAGPGKGVWEVCFLNGQLNVGAQGDDAYVRPVRGRPLEFGHFRDNGDGTITDMTTGLMWQQTESKAMTWERALAYCESLDLGGYRDWRLPNIRELLSLVDDSRRGPTISAIYFPGCRPSVYWSSTTQVGHPRFAWYVDFRDGGVPSGTYKERSHYMRAVRGGE
jgi:murein DD-endopeptidase MepM/ murein hydrolase activator NlpD